MTDFSFILIILLVVLGAGGFSFFYIKRENRRLGFGGGDSGLSLIKQDLIEIKNEIEKSRKENIETLQTQLRESGNIIKDVTSQLEKVHSDHQDVIGLKSGINKLTDVLANPKQRGILGEYFLENLLKNIFSPNQYKIQYQFSDGEIVDAVIFLKDKKIIPIDSKFSLENYNRIIEEKDPARREDLEKAFKQDLKKRIEETAKYIRPQENTTDFAFMFIPSEGIYYDLLVNQIGGIKSNTYDLIEYAFRKKRVIMVSPTSFYAYLQTVLEGLRALQIEESAKQIRKKVEDFQRHIISYDSLMKGLGGNLSTVINTYEKAYKEFAKIDKDVAKITEGEKQVEPVQINKPNI